MAPIAIVAAWLVSAGGAQAQVFGALQMKPFSGDISSDQAKLIQAFVLDLARQANTARVAGVAK